MKFGSAPGKKVEVRLSVTGKPERIVVRDWQWRPLPIKPEGGVLNLTLSPWPLYVQGLERVELKE
jgi:hypothetical protein